VKTKQKIYIGYNAHGSPRWFRNQVETLEKALERDFKIIDIKKVEQEAREGAGGNSYELSMNHLDEADLFVIMCDFASMGLGMEIEHAIEFCSTEIIAFISESKKVSVPNRLAEALESSQYESVHSYTSIDHVEQGIRGAMKKLLEEEVVVV
jgi:hypothetical protein